MTTPSHTDPHPGPDVDTPVDAADDRGPVDELEAGEDSGDDDPALRGPLPEPVARAADNLAYTVELPNFEGPLDLLLHLVRRHELDILDIPISFVCEKYLEYLALMRAMDLEVAGDYLVMAATLAYLKSRELVPSEKTAEGEEAASDDDGPDPRQELIERLLEYQKYKVAANELDARPVEGRDVFDRGGSVELPVVDPGLAPITLYRLAEAYQRVLERARIHKSHEVVLETISVAERMEQLTALLIERGRFDFEALFLERTWSSEGELRSMLVVTLMSVLELTKLGVIRVQQDSPISSIIVERVASVEEAREALSAFDEFASFGRPADLDDEEAPPSPEIGSDEPAEDVPGPLEELDALLAEVEAAQQGRSDVLRRSSEPTDTDAASPGDDGGEDGPFDADGVEDSARLDRADEDPLGDARDDDPPAWLGSDGRAGPDLPETERNDGPAWLGRVDEDDPFAAQSDDSAPRSRTSDEAEPSAGDGGGSRAWLGRSDEDEPSAGDGGGSRAWLGRSDEAEPSAGDGGGSRAWLGRSGEAEPSAGDNDGSQAWLGRSGEAEPSAGDNDGSRAWLGTSENPAEEVDASERDSVDASGGLDTAGRAGEGARSDRDSDDSPAGLEPDDGRASERDPFETNGAGWRSGLETGERRADAADSSAGDDDGASEDAETGDEDDGSRGDRIDSPAGADDRVAASGFGANERFARNGDGSGARLEHDGGRDDDDAFGAGDGGRDDPFEGDSADEGDGEPAESDNPDGEDAGLPSDDETLDLEAPPPIVVSFADDMIVFAEDEVLSSDDTVSFAEEQVSRGEDAVTIIDEPTPDAGEPEPADAAQEGEAEASAAESSRSTTPLSPVDEVGHDAPADATPEGDERLADEESDEHA